MYFLLNAIGMYCLDGVYSVEYEEIFIIERSLRLPCGEQIRVWQNGHKEETVVIQLRGGDGLV